jgi:hypothetical protein
MKAALLSAAVASGKGVYLRMIEIESADELTDHHLPADYGLLAGKRRFEAIK